MEGHACDQLQPQPRTSGEVGAELLKKSTLTDGSWRNIAIALTEPAGGFGVPAILLIDPKNSELSQPWPSGVDHLDAGHPLAFSDARTRMQDLA